jgi:hypothetical protein
MLTQMMENQFPDFDNKELFGELEASLAKYGCCDDSYRGDVSPKLANDEFVVFVDFADEGAREMGGEMLTVYKRTDTDSLETCLFSTDLPEMVVEHFAKYYDESGLCLWGPKAIALRFDYRLRDELGDEEYQEVLKRNRTASEGVCHSHDFCDANMVMEEALIDVLGSCEVMDNDEHTELWNKAWDFWKQSSR